MFRKTVLWAKVEKVIDFCILDSAYRDSIYKGSKIQSHLNVNFDLLFHPIKSITKHIANDIFVNSFMIQTKQNHMLGVS